MRRQTSGTSGEQGNRRPPTTALKLESKRQLRIELDFAQHDTGANLRDSRNLEDAFVQKRVVSLDIGRDDFKNVVRFAGRAVALGHLRAGRDFALELLDAPFGMPHQMNMRERADVQPQFLPVEQRRIALNDARLLHILDAAYRR